MRICLSWIIEEKTRDLPKRLKNFCWDFIWKKECFPKHYVLDPNLDMIMMESNCGLYEKSNQDLKHFLVFVNFGSRLFHELYVNEFFLFKKLYFSHGSKKYQKSKVNTSKYFTKINFNMKKQQNVINYPNCSLSQNIKI